MEVLYFQYVLIYDKKQSGYWQSEQGDVMNKVLQRLIYQMNSKQYGNYQQE